MSKDISFWDRVSYRFIKYLYRHRTRALSVHSDYDQFVNLNVKSLRSLRLGKSFEYCDSKDCAKKILLASRKPEYLYISKEAFILQSIQKQSFNLRKLVSLYLVGLDKLSPKQFQQTFLRQPLAIQHLTLEYQCFFSPKSYTSMLQRLTKLSNLKSFQFVTDSLDSFDLNSILFSTLKQRIIGYDIRAIHPMPLLTFSDNNISGLEVLSS